MALQMDKTRNIRLEVAPQRLAICRLAASTSIPDWAMKSSFYSISKTPDELSIVCDQALVPDGTKCEAGWRAFRVQGNLDFGLTGVLSSLATPLANAQISIFAISTFDTDYFLVKNESLERAMLALKSAGHEFCDGVQWS